MPLKIYLLGQFKLQANDLPIELPSRPAQSLLAYLALNSGVSHRREKLAALLWPEATESNARSYLRQALWRLRKSLDVESLGWENYLKISDLSITFDEQAEYWLDAGYLLDPVETNSVDEIIEGIRLYKGDLLPGFSDEWIVLERDRLQAAYHQEMTRLLECLLQSGQWDEALKWGEQWIRLGYSPEPAFRVLMRAHAGLGDPGMVNATYQRCAVALDRELGLEPSPETKQLREKILSGEMETLVSKPIPSISPTIQLPSFLLEGEPQQVEQRTFVAREREMAQLGEFLTRADAGRGRVIFITGETGSGKTALIDEFSRQSLESFTDLVVTSGNCNAHTGIGDPYLPFREILGQLTGDVDARYTAGSISRKHARRLWEILPLAVRTLVETGPDLIDSFVSGSKLVERAEIGTLKQEDWLTRLVELAEKEPGMIVPNPQQKDLFEQYAKVLQAVARQALLLMVVDDLQWADLGSISLLFHLGRHLAGSRILIVGAYRPEEVALGREGERHPLVPVVNELQREYGDILLNVDQADRRTFVEALLDCEPNLLGDSFREMFYNQTSGHALFSVELLQGMQERGDLEKNQAGQWVEGSALDWETLPARVEAVVAERISRLAQPLQSALRIASVEGETFTAEVVAQISGIDKNEMLAYLSAELSKKHRLIRAQSIQRLDGQLISRYQFQHIISQKYLYGSLDPVERVHLHEQVANSLEGLYGAQEVADTDIAPQLARHFEAARIQQKAIHYLHLAGKRAVELSAINEATTLLNRALALLMDLPHSLKRDQQELALQLTLGMAWISSSSPGEETQNAYSRARQLCQLTGESTQLVQILTGLSVYNYVRAEHQRGIEIAQEALNIAQESDNILLMWLGHWGHAFNWFARGNYKQAREHLAQITCSYDPQQHHLSLVNLHASDAGLGALAYESCCVWCLGYPDQAKKTGQKALKFARELDHPFSLADVLCYAGCELNAMLGDPDELRKNMEEMLNLATEFNYRGWYSRSICYYGLTQIRMGQTEQGIANINSGIADNRDTRNWLHMACLYSFIAEAYLKINQPREGLQSLDEAFNLIEKFDAHHWEPEAYRLKGELQLMLEDETEAEASFAKAIDIARSQQARSWELRATMSWAQFWHNRGRTKEAMQDLGEIYNWFTEGFNTPDLIEAKSLLDKWS